MKNLQYSNIYNRFLFSRLKFMEGTLSLLDFSKLDKLYYIEFFKRRFMIEFINMYKDKSQSHIEYEDVGFLDLGLSICYYTYANYSNKSKYMRIAEDLLDNIYLEAQNNKTLCIENGLLGISCGLIYLIRNRFVIANEDLVLSEVDDILINTLLNKENDVIPFWSDWLHYFRLRIFCIRSSEYLLYEVIYRSHAIYLLDCLYRYVMEVKDIDSRIRYEVMFFHQKKISIETTTGILSYCNSINNVIKKELFSVNNDKISIVIPIRIDSLERERNLNVVVEKLSLLPNVDILILEGDFKSKCRLKKKYNNVNYFFIYDTDPVFHRTKYINILLQKSKSPIVGVWDADVLLPEDQIIKAIDIIKSGKVIMSFPYDGHFYSLSQEDSNIFLKKMSINWLRENISKMNLTHGRHSVGGAFFVNRNEYINLGGENEKIYGWGPEDVERVKRLKGLGFQIFRTEGPLFHLYHPRNQNSWFFDKEIELQNRQVLLEICSMTKAELCQYLDLEI